MDAKSFLDLHGKEVATAVAEKAGTNYPYYSQIAYGHRRPSPELAKALVEASAEFFPDPAEQLDFNSLLFPSLQQAA